MVLRDNPVRCFTSGSLRIVFDMLAHLEMLLNVFTSSMLWKLTNRWVSYENITHHKTESRGIPNGVNKEKNFQQENVYQ
jgi:prolyl-tRNA synthetase